MSLLVWDIETEGLAADSKIHCMVIKSRTTGSVDKYHTTTQKYIAAQRIMESPNICHNQIEYDQYVLKYHYPWFKPHPQSFDTLVMSRMLYPKMGFKHGLGPWGERVGVSKPEIDNWTDLTIEEYLHRCEEDVHINDKVFDKLVSKAEDMKAWSPAFRLEHKVSLIHSKQHRVGVLVDKPLCEKLITRTAKVIEGIDDKALPLLPYVYDKVDGRFPVAKREEMGEFKYQAQPFTQTGKLRHWITPWEHDGKDHEVVGPFARVEFRKVNPGSDKEVKKFLLDEGWVPEEYNWSKTEVDSRGRPVRKSPKMSQKDAFIGVSSIAGKILARRVQVRHRNSNCKGILDRVREDGRISSDANPQSTPTARYSHKGLVNIPGAKAYLGREMRSMFIAKPGYHILGIDVDSCQLYALANRMDDAAFTAALTKGNSKDCTDAHSLNAGILSGVCGREVTRDDAKTWIYAFLFGARDGKLGGILGGNSQLGSRSRAAFLSTFPKLDKLIQRIERVAKVKGYITGLDGRRIYVESPRKALNYQLQSDEAIFVKVLMTYIDQGTAQQLLDAKQVIQMHDELQFEVLTAHGEQLKLLCEDSFSKASVLLDLKVPMTGTASIGSSWYDTH